MLQCNVTKLLHIKARCFTSMAVLVGRHVCVQVAHGGVIAACVLVLVLGDLYVILTDAIWLSGLMIHWLCNDTTCVLTMLEHFPFSIFREKAGLCYCFIAA